MKLQKKSFHLNQKKPKRSFSSFFSGFKRYFIQFSTCLTSLIAFFELKFSKLSIFSQKVSQSPESTNFRSSYFSRNQQKFFYSNCFLGFLQALIDLIQLLSESNSNSHINLLIFLLNLFITLISCLLQYKISKKILIFILVNFIRVILDITLRFPAYVDQNSENNDFSSYSMFYLNQNIIMILLVNSHVISNIYLKKLSWVFIQFLIFAYVVVSINYLSFSILKVFIYTYIHVMLANILINFEVGVYQEVYDFKEETGKEKFEIEQILNIISNGILILDFDLSQALFANKKLLEMFEMPQELNELKEINIKQLLEMFAKQISKITERIFYGKEEKNENKTHFFALEKKEKKTNERDFYLNTYSKFQDLFINLRGNFEYMHKRNMAQNLSALRFSKRLQLIIKPTVYKQKKAFFLIFNQEFEGEFESKETKIKEYKSKSLYDDNKISLNFLTDFIYKLKIPLSMITNVFRLIIEKKIKKNQNLLNSILCALNYQEIIMHNLLEILIFSPDFIAIHYKTINFKSLFNEMSRNFSYLAEIKDISFTINIDEKLPSEFKSDEFKLKQILYLLLDNALKFSPNGGVVKLIAKYKPILKKVKISIYDTGIGISIDGLTSLKKLLSEPDLRLFLEKDGQDTGKLGLLFCQNYVLILNKSEPLGIKIKSKESESSQFSFFLDLEDSQEKISIVDQEMQANLKSPVLKYISRNDTGLLINLNKTVKIDNYHISEEFLSRLTQLREKTETKKQTLMKSEEFNYDLEVENSPHLATNVMKYSMENYLPLSHFQKNVPIGDFIGKIEENNLEMQFEEEEMSQMISEEVLIINSSYFHLITLKTLCGLMGYKYVKYFEIQPALKNLAAKTQNNSIDNLFKVILLEVGLNLEENLANVKILKKGFSNKKIPYIPILGYTSLENKEAGDILIENGMSDILYFPITEEEFQRKISPWISREKKS